MLVSLLRDFKLSDFTLIYSFPDRVDGDIILIVSDSSCHPTTQPSLCKTWRQSFVFIVYPKKLNPDPDSQMDTESLEEIN